MTQWGSQLMEPHLLTPAPPLHARAISGSRGSRGSSGPPSKRAMFAPGQWVLLANALEAEPGDHRVEMQGENHIVGHPYRSPCRAESATRYNPGDMAVLT